LEHFRRLHGDDGPQRKTIRCAAPLSLPQPSPDRFRRRFTGLDCDASAEYVDAAAFEAIVIGIAPKLRGAEVGPTCAVATIGKLFRRVLSKERPHVKIFDPVNAAYVMLCGALAQTHREQQIGVGFAKLAVSTKQAAEIVPSQVFKAVQVRRLDPFKGALRLNHRSLGSCE